MRPMIHFNWMHPQGSHNIGGKIVMKIPTDKI